MAYPKLDKDVGMLRMNPAGPAKLPHYSEKRGMWLGGDGETLYAFTDKRTGKIHVAPGNQFKRLGPEMDVRVATLDEAKDHWQYPLHWRWKTENPAGLTAKGERMYEHIKESYAGDPRAKEIAARTVLARASEGAPGLKENAMRSKRAPRKMTLTDFVDRYEGRLSVRIDHPREGKTRIQILDDRGDLLSEDTASSTTRAWERAYYEWQALYSGSDDEG